MPSKNEFVRFRTSKKEKKAYVKLAKNEGMDLSSLIRLLLNNLMKRRGK